MAFSPEELELVRLLIGVAWKSGVTDPGTAIALIKFQQKVDGALESLSRPRPPAPPTPTPAAPPESEEKT